MNKILVVDNHPIILKFMVTVLEKEGYKVVTAEDSISALEILKTYLPSLNKSISSSPPKWGSGS